jgi:hypothetical protein
MILWPAQVKETGYLNFFIWFQIVNLSSYLKWPSTSSPPIYTRNKTWQCNQVNLIYLTYLIMSLGTLCVNWYWWWRCWWVIWSWFPWREVFCVGGRIRGEWGWIWGCSGWGWHAISCVIYIEMYMHAQSISETILIGKTRSRL